MKLSVVIAGNWWQWAHAQETVDGNCTTAG